MMRYDNHHERMLAKSRDREMEQSPDNQGVGELWNSNEEETFEVVCLECCAKFTASTEVDECEVCGSSDLDLA